MSVASRWACSQSTTTIEALATETAVGGIPTHLVARIVAISHRRTSWKRKRYESVVRKHFWGTTHGELLSKQAAVQPFNTQREDFGMIGKKHLGYVFGLLLFWGGIATADDIPPGLAKDFDNGCLRIVIPTPVQPDSASGLFSVTDLGVGDTVGHKVTYDFEGGVLLAAGLCPTIEPCPSFVIELLDSSGNLVFLNSLLADPVIPLSTPSRSGAARALRGGKYCYESTSANRVSWTYVWDNGSIKCTVTVDYDLNIYWVTYPDGTEVKGALSASQNSTPAGQLPPLAPIKQLFKNDMPDTAQVSLDRTNRACLRGLGVPAASDWSLAIMFLVVLAGGSVVIRGRMPRVEKRIP